MSWSTLNSNMARGGLLTVAEFVGHASGIVSVIVSVVLVGLIISSGNG